jgi:Uma2 family endonuclease
MENILTSFPSTRMELAMLGGDELQRFPASMDEYWELLEEADFKADFYKNEIIAKSYETDRHSDIVTEILHILKKIFPKPNLNFKVHNPNRPICIPDCDNAIFNPDGSVVSQPPVYFEYRPGMNAETTPILVFEVLSKNTRAYDIAEKLPCYKKIPSLRQILYVDTLKPFVSVFERVGESNQWLTTDFEKADDFILINGKTVSLKEIYQDVFFE